MTKGFKPPAGGFFHGIAVEKGGGNWYNKTIEIKWRQMLFEYIKGTLEDQSADYVVVDNNGIGYRVSVSLNTLAELPALHQELCLLLHPVYREDDIALYGFITHEERDLFRTLIGVSGVGPKVAMGMLSQFVGGELIRYILNADAKSIAKAPGIGKKTAERVILELKDKYKNYEPHSDVEVDGGAVENLRLTDNLFNEAVNGLLGLGFAYSEASDLVERVITPDMAIEEILQKALMSANTRN